MYSPQAFDKTAFLRLAPPWQNKFYYFPVIGSTNQEARQRLRSASRPGEMILLADRQEAGRGRLNRPWSAPFAAGLLCSVTLPLDPLPLDRAYLFTAALALSIRQAVLSETGQALDLKWPNDLLRGGKKCCGILAEIETGLGPQRDSNWLVAGFGINIALTSLDLEKAGLTGQATNLTPPEVTPPSRETLLALILANLSAYRRRLESDPDSVRQEWAAGLITLGKAVQVLDLAGRFQLAGTAVGVDRGGGLLVQSAEGVIRSVQAGDVSVRLNDGTYA